MGERGERWERVKGEGRSEEDRGKGESGGSAWRVGGRGICPICVIYLCMLLYTFIYFQIRPNTFKYHYIPSHTSRYVKIYLFKEHEARRKSQKWS